MKRILLLLFSLITTAAIGQYPINQILSSDSTMVSVGRNATGGIRGGLVNMVFADTTAANLSRISYYTGAQIWTTTDSAIWVRFKGTPSFWVKMAGASGGTTGSFWNITGNYFGGGVPLNYGVGTNSYDYLPFKTNNITRLLIPPDGILRSSAPANKYLMMDTTTLEMYYGDGGGGSGWSLTGNAGTTSSNFIGTTDNQPLSFRVNNNWAGRIYTNGSVFIGDSSGVNNSALNNAGFGRYSLYNNTTGSYNTGSGAYSLYGNTTGLDNTGSGAYSLYSNTSGESNTGSGAYSLYGNTTGWYNTGSGAYSLYGNTTGLDNTGSGAYSLYGNTTGSNNTGSGAYSLYSNTSGEGNTGSGAYSLYSNIDGELNTGSGVYSLRNNTTGGSNTGSGVYSLYNNTTGEGNTGSGVYSLRNNTTGSNNTGMGYAAGYDDKQKVDAKNQILIGANTYGTRDSITVLGASFIKETIVRGKLIDSTLSAGSGTKAVRWDSSTGEFTYADTSEVITPTWQQTLTAGSTLTQDNTITSTGYDFSFNGQNIQFNATDGLDLTGTIAGTTSTISVDGSQLTLRNSRSGATSGLDIRADSIMIEPHLGLLKIDTLAAASSQNQLIGWTSTSGANRGKVGAVTIGTGLSLSSGTLNSVWTASGNDVYNNNSGNVGIGTSTPQATLHVSGSSGTTLRIVDGNQGANKVLVSDADGDASWATIGSIGVPINNLLAATGSNDINNGNNPQAWRWDSLSSNVGLGLYATTTAASSGSDILLEAAVDGANADSVRTTISTQISNSHTGTTSTNIGLKAIAINGTNNYAIIVPSGGGSVGIGTSTPATKFHTVGTVRHQTLGTAITDTTTYKPLVINSSGDVLPSTYWYGGGVNLVFGGGSGASADTAVFTTSAIYGSFYNDADTIVVTSMRSVLQGTSPDVTYKVWYNDSLNVEAGATALVTAGSQVTNTTTGTNVTSFDVTKIPPGVWVWVKTSAVTTKPTYFSLTINANR